MPFPIIVLAIVFLLIAVRQVGRLRVGIWLAMALGAAAVLATGWITPSDALKAVNLDVMLFLFGMFVVAQALEQSGYLACLSAKFFGNSRSADALVLSVLFGFGFGSAFLLNDTLAIIGTPAVLMLAKMHGISPKVMLLALAFAVTTGSVFSPIGNPQNLIVAIDGGLGNPFITFFLYLAVPSILNLILAWLFLKIYYRKDFKSFKPAAMKMEICDPRLARISKISLIIILVLVAAKIACVLCKAPFEFRLTYIALAAAAPILLVSPKRIQIFMKIDWCTLIFFASMFVLMQSVWDTGFFQGIISKLGLNIASIVVVLGVSVILSQFISNVPLVALYLPMLMAAGASPESLMALAAGSTIAGNFSVLGAASNVIIIQNAEKKTGDTLKFIEFAAIGVPLTIINTGIYWLFLQIF
jgi:Na+/H+ antiporter NhaD/arsenite permease-like protein